MTDEATAVFAVRSVDGTSLQAARYESGRWITRHLTIGLGLLAVAAAFGTACARGDEAARTDTAAAAPAVLE